MLLVAPSGVVDNDNVVDRKLHTTYIYARNFWRQPAIVLPSPEQYTVLVKFSPLLYKLRTLVDDKAKMPIPLPYRMVFAVATKCSIFLYDTQQQIPFGSISNIHYTRLTDLAWSSDGKILLVSSTDGFCSVITFGDDELGEIYNKESSKANEFTEKPNEKFEPTEKSEYKKVKKSITSTNKSEKLNIKTTNLTSNPVDFNRKPRDKLQVSTEANVPEKNKTIEIPAVKIIRSDKKFESPEKKNKPVTPIAVRRHPRPINVSPESGNDIAIKLEQNNMAIYENVLSTQPCTSIKTSVSRNSPTPIAVRRHPRT
jgi:chromatin assembly factor 1 subunit B